MSYNKLLLNFDHFYQLQVALTPAYFFVNKFNTYRAKSYVTAKYNYARHLMNINEPTYLLVNDILDFPEEFTVTTNERSLSFCNYSNHHTLSCEIKHPNNITTIDIEVQGYCILDSFEKIHNLNFCLNNLTFLNTHERLEVEEALRISSKSLHDKIEAEKLAQKEQNAEKERRQVQKDLLEWHKSKQES